MGVSRTVRVEAPARIHFGLLDLRGDLGRRFGGLGAAVRRPRTVIEARRAGRLSAAGPEAGRAGDFARRFLRHHGISGGAEIHVREAIPAHVGLGSGTQLALAVGRALAELHGTARGAEAIARATGRVGRSGVGTWTFERGGFVLEGGRREEGRAGAPLLFHRSLPAVWRCVVAIPDAPRGLSGAAEREAFARLRPPTVRRAGTIARLALLGALPALVEEDLVAFGEAVTRIGEQVGECFREVQGGRFATPETARLVRRLRRAGARGAGQSSWGPAVFALAGDEEEAMRLAAVASRTGGVGTVLVTPFADRGARLPR